MRYKKNDKNGFSLGEVIIIIVVVGIVALLIFGVFGKKNDSKVKEPERTKYKCLTTESGLVPLKVVTANPNNVIVYNKPETGSQSGKALGFFKAFFVFKEKGGFYQIGTDPLSEQTLGWIKKLDGIVWHHREALELKVKPNAQPIYIWENKADVNNTSKVNYEQRTDNSKRLRYPVLDVNGHHYKIALTWQTANWDKKGAAAGWTSPIKTPQDANVVCYITRQELETRLEKLLAILKELQTKPYSDHPIIQLFKEDLGITFGQGLDLEDESIGFLKKVAGEAPKMPAVFKKHPDEIRGELRKVWKTFTRLRVFFEDSSNWDNRGGGWIPIELIPGN